MDHISTRLAAYAWPYASQDPSSYSIIKARVAEAGRRGGLLTYAELVSGIDFHLPSVQQGNAIRLGVPEWADLHRAILGDFLGRLCVDTYADGMFMGSALVVASESGQPSEGYRGLMRAWAFFMASGKASSSNTGWRKRGRPTHGTRRTRNRSPNNAMNLTNRGVPGLRERRPSGEPAHG